MRDLGGQNLFRGVGETPVARQHLDLLLRTLKNPSSPGACCAQSLFELVDRTFAIRPPISAIHLDPDWAQVLRCVVQFLLAPTTAAACAEMKRTLLFCRCDLADRTVGSLHEAHTHYDAAACYSLVLYRLSTLVCDVLDDSRRHAKAVGRQRRKHEGTPSDSQRSPWPPQNPDQLLGGVPPRRAVEAFNAWIGDPLSSGVYSAFAAMMAFSHSLRAELWMNAHPFVDQAVTHLEQTVDHVHGVDGQLDIHDFVALDSCANQFLPKLAECRVMGADVTSDGAFLRLQRLASRALACLKRISPPLVGAIAIFEAYRVTTATPLPPCSHLLSVMRDWRRAPPLLRLPARPLLWSSGRRGAISSETFQSLSPLQCQKKDWIACHRGLCHAIKQLRRTIDLAPDDRWAQVVDGDDVDGLIRFQHRCDEHGVPPATLARLSDQIASLLRQ
ncbi:hypothetical protein C8R43DRAFT_1118556 [Mycena crocata]|nr:hypothetical protein C8R43DRAFT_1118556 [Mycena crocata]